MGSKCKPKNIVSLTRTLTPNTHSQSTCVDVQNHLHVHCITCVPNYSAAAAQNSLSKEQVYICE